MPDITRKLRITGRVQGVSYRAWTMAEALKLGLTGYVQNEDDGSVTALVTGPRDRIDELVTLCHGGPGAADVREVTVLEAPDPGLTDFDIRR